MTDNSSAEKGALRFLWPESLQLLCGFHVGQAEWDWINSNISKENKKIFMNAFQQVMFAVAILKIRLVAGNCFKGMSLYIDPIC